MIGLLIHIDTILSYVQELWWPPSGADIVRALVRRKPTSHYQSHWCIVIFVLNTIVQFIQCLLYLSDAPHQTSIAPFVGSNQNLQPEHCLQYSSDVCMLFLEYSSCVFVLHHDDTSPGTEDTPKKLR